jgi:hypothetical protein
MIPYTGLASVDTPTKRGIRHCWVSELVPEKLQSWFLPVVSWSFQDISLDLESQVRESILGGSIGVSYQYIM